VKNIRVVSPKPSPEVLAAAAMLGMREFYRVGGAQAIAGIGIWDSSIPRVDKIVGPETRLSRLRRKLVSFDCAIDFLAGLRKPLFLATLDSRNSLQPIWSRRPEHDAEGAWLCFITASPGLARSVEAECGETCEGESNR